MIADALFLLLSSTQPAAVNIQAKLATYGPTNKPAIFTSDVPNDCKYPVIQIQELTALQGPEGTRDKPGVLLTVNVLVYGSKTYSIKFLRDLAWQIWTFLNRVNLDAYLNPLGYVNWGCIADPPVSSPDDSGYPGFMIKTTVHATVQ